MPDHAGALLAITLVAAIVNGALGYGFSTIAVPLALLFFTNRVLNPALVLVEVAMNAWLVVMNRDALPAVRKRVLPLVAGATPGILAGTLIVARLNPAWLKLATFVTLLPLILAQAAGIRRPFRSERAVGFGLGGGVGALYAVTTVSGPPLALLLNNQGLTKHEFRAALGLIRLALSATASVAYASTGLFTAGSAGLLPAMLPALAVGVPIGGWIVRRVNAETFRRICMSFDAWIVAFAISMLARALRLLDPGAAYGIFAAVVVIDAVLLYRFFSGARSGSPSFARVAAAEE